MKILRRPGVTLLILVTLTGATVTGLGVDAQQRPAPRPARPPASPEAHGVPKGWRFTLPKGDPARGREAFDRFECYKCHDVKGESFPKSTIGENVGPELAEESPHHPAEFLAESIMNPSAVIDEPRFRGPDRSSRMPSFNDSMTVQELIDLVAFLKSLTPPAPKGGTREHKH